MNRRESLLGPFSPPLPPRDLREKALAAAEAAWEAAPGEAWVRRAGFTRWDWAWAAGLALLLLGNLLVGGRPRKSAAPPSPANRERAEIEELAGLGIVLPPHHRAPQRLRIPQEVDDLSGAAGADL